MAESKQRLPVSMQRLPVQVETACVHVETASLRHLIQGQLSILKKFLFNNLYRKTNCIQVYFFRNQISPEEIFGPLSHRIVTLYLVPCTFCLYFFTRVGRYCFFSLNFMKRHGFAVHLGTVQYRGLPFFYFFYSFFKFLIRLIFVPKILFAQLSQLKINFWSSTLDSNST